MARSSGTLASPMTINAIREMISPPVRIGVLPNSELNTLIAARHIDLNVAEIGRGARLDRLPVDQRPASPASK